MEEVKILGGGISGLSAAITLERSDRFRPVVFERNGDVGTRFNGDFQGLNNWSYSKDILNILKGVGLEREFYCKPFSEIEISNGSKSTRPSSEEPAFYLVRRGQGSDTLDQAFKREAMERDVDIRFGEVIDEEEADIVAKGPEPSRSPAIVKGMTFSTDNKKRCTMLLGDRFAYKGYSYLFTVDGKGCICSVTFDDLSEVGGCFERTRNYFTEEYSFDIKDSDLFTGLGNFGMDRNLVSGDRLYVGESANLQDFLWGFGMDKAVVSGYIASKSFEKGVSYEESAKNIFDDIVKSSIVNRFMWEISRFDRFSMFLSAVERSKGFLNVLRNFHSFNMLQELLYPLSVIYDKQVYRDSI